MIHLQKYSSLRGAAKGLAEALKKHQPTDPLVEQTIIVPNMDTARWLKLELTEISGLSANLRMILPSDWQYGQIRRLYPELPKKLPSDILPMTWSLFDLLSVEEKCRQFSVLHNYITRQTAVNRETAIWQLSSQIASVLDQYLVYRPGMVLGWQQYKKRKNRDEEWQSDLWNQLNNDWKQLSDPIYHINRAELHRDLIKAYQTNEIECSEPLFIFNPGLLPLPLLESIKCFSNKQEVIFTYTSPIHEKNVTADKVSNPLLGSLGHEAFDTEQVYIKTFGSIQTRSVASGRVNQKVDSESNLNRIQQSIRHNITAKPGESPDKSIRIHSCHSALREIETLYQALLEMFEEDDDLTPDDILVVTPDPDLYKSFISAVFGTKEEGLPAIPWHLSSGSSRENMIEKSLMKWFELPDSRFRKQPVLDLFLIQPVREKMGISDTDVNELKEWISDNSVMWGLDAEHRKEMGQPPVNAQTWYSAMKRGWLGQWMADEPGIIYDDTLLYTGIRTASQKETWAAFSEYLHLLDRARKEALIPRTGFDWCRWIEEMLGELIGSDALLQKEASMVRGVLDQIKQSCETAGSLEKVSFGMIRSVITSLLDLKSSAGALFTRGVTFSSMVPVRSIPFRVIAMIGLNEGAFPRKETVIDFDLMAQYPEPGERNRKHEDRNLFLESVLAATDIHYISYVGQSPVDNEEIPPSTIVTEWIDMVLAVSSTDWDQVVQKEALHLFSESYFSQQNRGVYSKLAYQTASGLKSRESSSQGLTPDFSRDLDYEWLQGVTLNNFISFFKNPVRSYLTDQIGASLRSPEEEKDEFSLNNLEKHLIFQKMMSLLISGQSETEIFNLISHASLVTEGWAGESLLAELLSNGKTALGFLRDLGEVPKFTELRIDLQIEDIHFSDSLQSFRSDSLLDIEPSGLSGVLIIQTWIRHLIWQASSGTKTTSGLLCELKKGAPRWCTFQPAEKPLEILRNLLKLYQKGQSEPLFFFPRSLYAFKETESKGKGEQSAAEAAKVFEGGDYSFGEKDDMSIQIMLGPEAEFKSDYLKDEYLDVMSEIFNHLEVQS